MRKTCAHNFIRQIVLGEINEDLETFETKKRGKKPLDISALKDETRKLFTANDSLTQSASVNLLSNDIKFSPSTASRTLKDMN